MSVFSKTKSPPRPSITEAIAQLAAFEPPPKPVEMIEAETARAEAQRAHQSARRELDELCQAWRAADASPAATTRPSRQRIAELEAAVAARHRELAKARKAAEVASLKWRREYAKALRLAMWPVRQALHAVVAGEVRDAARALGIASTRATNLKVGSVWISRNADDFVALAERLASAVDFDKKLGGP